MNIGLPELGVLGFLLLILFGAKKSGSKKTKSTTEEKTSNKVGGTAPYTQSPTQTKEEV